MFSLHLDPQSVIFCRKLLLTQRPTRLTLEIPMFVSTAEKSHRIHKHVRVGGFSHWILFHPENKAPVLFMTTSAVFSTLCLTSCLYAPPLYLFNCSPTRHGRCTFQVGFPDLLPYVTSSKFYFFWARSILWRGVTWFDWGHTGTSIAIAQQEVLSTAEKMWNWSSGKKSAGESNLRVIDIEAILEVEKRYPRVSSLGDAYL